MNKRLQHDAAFALAKQLREVMADSIREDDRFEALQLFYRICMAGMESYEMQREQLRPRLNPLLM